MTNKLQQLKSKKDFEFYQRIIKNYDEMNHRRQSGYFQMNGDRFDKNARSIANIYYVFLIQVHLHLQVFFFLKIF